MSRERKLSKWSLTNALSRSRTVVQAARYLGVHRDTVYENAKKFEVDIPAVLGGKPAHSDTPAANAPQPQPKPLTEQEIAQLRAHGWQEHDCTGDERCSFCRELLDANGEPRRAPRNHLVNPASFGIAARPRSPELWRSYAPKRRT